MLARMDANMKSMQERMDASQEMYADMKCNQEQILAKMEANRETDLANLKRMLEERQEGRLFSRKAGWPKTDDRLPRGDRDRDRSRNDAVHRGASRDPQGRGRSNVGRRTEEES
jgi:hypothetical protein